MQLLHSFFIIYLSSIGRGKSAVILNIGTVVVCCRCEPRIMRYIFYITTQLGVQYYCYIQVI